MSAAPPAAEPGAAHDKIVLLYDYSKHLLSLALLGIGGIVSVTQSPQGQGIPGPVVAMMLGALALAGFCALGCSANILRARREDRPVGRGAWLGSQFAMIFLGVGVGGFIIVWIQRIVS